MKTALSHTSWCAENLGKPSNQRLEFLGDAVLGLVVAHWLYTEHNTLMEGQMSKARAEIVSGDALAMSARDHNLGAQLLLGRGEDTSGGRDNPSLLSDALEAVIGAVYLDGGLEEADAVIRRILGKTLKTVVKAPGYTDFKSRLQEIAAHAGIDPPEYDITHSGPEHNKRFHAFVTVGETVGAGEGHSKKDASQRAAQKVCEKLLTELT